MGSFEVVTDWKATYEHPITLEEGDELWLSGKSDNWGGHIWIWAKDRTGREGWIPDNLVKRIGLKTYAKASFSAQELTCREGERLDAINQTHGWVLCRNTHGQVGWVPSKNLRETKGSQRP